MTCRDVMTNGPAYCVPTDSAARVAKLMKTEDVGSIPVCESRQNRKLVGIVTDRDLAIRIVADGKDPNGISVQECMTGDPVTCRPEDDLNTATDTMQQRQIRRVPIVGRGGELVGIVAMADIATRTQMADKTAETIGRISKPVTARAA